MDFRHSLVSQMGYISDDQIPDAIRELGGDFVVIKKDFMGQRRAVELQNLNHYDRNVREVFVSAPSFQDLKGRWGM